MKKLEELVQDSYAGCITDFEDIGRIMMRISGLSCGEGKEERDRRHFQKMKKNLCQKTQEWDIRIDARTSIGDLLKQAENLRNTC